MSMQHKQTSKFLFLFALSIYLLFASFRIDSGDGESMYKVACSIVEGNKFAVDLIARKEDSFSAWGEIEPVELFNGGDGYGMWGRDDKYYSKYGLGWSLIAAPFCGLGHVINRVINTPFTDKFTTRLTVMLVNPLIAASTVVLFFQFALYIYSNQMICCSHLL